MSFFLQRVVARVVPHEHDGAGLLPRSAAGRRPRCAEEIFPKAVDFGRWGSCRWRKGRHGASRQRRKTMTQYLLSVYFDESAELPSDEMMKKMYADVDALNQEIKSEG